MKYLQRRQRFVYNKNHLQFWVVHSVISDKMDENMWEYIKWNQLTSSFVQSEVDYDIIAVV